MAQTVDANTTGLQYFDRLKTIGPGAPTEFFLPLELTQLIERALQGSGREERLRGEPGEVNRS